MKSTNGIKAFGIILGLMFGAGVFALPFAFAQGGVFWGIFHLVIAALLTLFVLFLYAEVTYAIKGRHRFVGYISLILGKGYKKFAFAMNLVVYYAVLLAYGVLGGIFVSNFFGGSYAFEAALIFFATGALLAALKLSKVAFINFYLTIPLVAFVFYLFLNSWHFIDLSNFSLGLNKFSLYDSAWFLPYGIWLFALAAQAAIPEAHDVFFPAPLRSFKKVILVSILLAVVSYCLFVAGILGVSGEKTTQDALAGILSILGNKVLLVGSLIGILAVFTSFLAMAVDLRDSFRYDFGFSKAVAWFLVVLPPVVFFLLGFQNFTKILSLAGSLGFAFTGTFIILMARKIRGLGQMKEIIVIVAILLAVVYELYHILL
jgi:amino acid permease